MFFLCFKDGLNLTGMNNRYAFGLWIVFDLAIIALGAGAFFLGFLSYILKREKLKPIMNTAVIVGFICYSGAMATLVEYSSLSPFSSLAKASEPFRPGVSR